MTTFSIIVPMYNEAEDISETLQALEKLDYPNYEIILVDDASTDDTVKLAEAVCLRDSHFRLLRQPKNQGVSAARNRGILAASGEVVVILNADVLLPADFLKRIAVHYQAGAKWVAVWCNAVNRNRFLARFTQLNSDVRYLVEKHHWVWTEGFSCTKEAAIDVGLFPESMPGCSGEDVDFGLLLEQRFPGIKDTEIVVPHIAPDTYQGFWSQNRGRGRGTTNVYFYMRHYSKLRLLVRTFLASAKRSLKLLLGGPFFRAVKISRYSEKGYFDIIPLAMAGYLQELAQLRGLWEGFVRLDSARIE